jgi:hypothetical protein
VSSRVRAAVFDGLKGAAAEGDIPAGEAVVSLPLAALLTPRVAYAAPVLGDALRQIPGLDDDRAVLLWTMRERLNLDPQSPHAPRYELESVSAGGYQAPVLRA